MWSAPILTSGSQQYNLTHTPHHQPETFRAKPLTGSKHQSQVINQGNKMSENTSRAYIFRPQQFRRAQEAQQQQEAQERERQFTGSHPQEEFETTMDDEGNPAPDESFTDGAKKKGHAGADDEADLFDAAQADFDDL
ncbi:hypothetical protein BDW62DRAFT_196805 [Aspergillus aurantiobrunneus]